MAAFALSASSIWLLLTSTPKTDSKCGERRKVLWPEPQPTSSAKDYNEYSIKELF